MSLASQLYTWCRRGNISHALQSFEKANTLVRGSLTRGHSIVPVRFYPYRPRALEPVKTPRAVPIKKLPCFEIFSPKVCKFIAQRNWENKDSGKLAWVTSFTDGKPVGLVELNDFVFGCNPRIDILQRVVVWWRAKRRAGTACVKSKAEVRGGGRKPWRQKGMNKARQGSIRAPHFRGGGVVHGPKPKSYYYRLPKKVRRMGLRVALSIKYAQGDLHIVDTFDDIESDRDLIPILHDKGWNSATLIDAKLSSPLVLAAEPLSRVDVLTAGRLNVYSLLLRPKVILTVGAIRVLEERLCEDNRILSNKFSEHIRNAGRISS